MKNNINQFYSIENCKLASMLLSANIPFQFRDLYDGTQILFPSIENCIADAVCHSNSCGHEKGLLEIMGVGVQDVADDVEGYLTAEEVFRRWSAYYDQKEGAVIV